MKNDHFVPQICSHFQCSDNIRTDNLTIAVDKNINTFYYIQENLGNKNNTVMVNGNLKLSVKTHRNQPTSFFLYRIPSLRQDTAFVTAMGGLCVTSILYASVLINSLRILASVYWGYPKSIISSSNSYCQKEKNNMRLTTINSTSIKNESTVHTS